MAERLVELLRRKRAETTPGPEDIQGGIGDLFRQPPAGVMHLPNLPSISLETMGAAGKPQIGAAVSTPMMGGNLGFIGNYQPGQPGSQPNYGGMIRFNKEF